MKKGDAISIDLEGGFLIFGNGVSGIIKGITKNVIVLDYCDSGNKVQYINRKKIISLSILNKEEKTELIDYYGEDKEKEKGE